MPPHPSGNPDADDLQFGMQQSSEAMPGQLSQKSAQQLFSWRQFWSHWQADSASNTPQDPLQLNGVALEFVAQ